MSSGSKKTENPWLANLRCFWSIKTSTPDERTNGSWHGTQDAADAAALAAGVGFSAHQGAVTIPNGWATGWIYNPTDDTWRTFKVSNLDELGQRKAAAAALYAALDGQEQEIGHRMGIPSKVSGRVRDVLAFARWACYSIFTGTTYTAAQQIAWAGAMLTGPSDAADLDTLIQKSSALTDAEVPTATAAWVSPVDASRSALAGSKVAERTMERRYRRPDGTQPRQRRMDSGYRLAPV